MPDHRPRLPSLRHPPIAFAHRGARAHAPENTLESFRLALRLGATGLETDLWLTADGEVVLDHDGVVGRVRRRPVSSLRRVDLASHIPALGDLYASCGTGFELSVDVKDEAAAEAAVAVARAAGEGAVDRLWLCHPDWERAAAWRRRFPDARVVNSTRLRGMRGGPERRAAALASAGIDAVNLHHSDWSGGLTTLFHRFEVLAFGWDAQYERILDGLVDMGIDGMYSDHVDRMVDAIARYT
ncbi:MAG: glycerophosphodiester phosphodiesterase [Acidimicrobiales bacterium]